MEWLNNKKNMFIVLLELKIKTTFVFAFHSTMRFSTSLIKRALIITSEFSLRYKFYICFQKKIVNDLSSLSLWMML